MGVCLAIGLVQSGILLPPSALLTPSYLHSAGGHTVADFRLSVVAQRRHVSVLL